MCHYRQGANSCIVIPESSNLKNFHSNKPSGAFAGFPERGGPLGSRPFSFVAANRLEEKYEK
jgi:hypothetical protein